ncbi:MAG: ATP-dependent DNA helicase, partial [Limosilactobacillus sp.]|nr:ATP-dependent DNA helicase [Limosilactobacillus sp.]
FATGTDSVLLGAASFWEGIDLPEDQLQLLIVTRLPFDSPDDVLVKAQHEHLKRQGKSPFYQVDLPQMIMRMRQGIGRLLRTDRDYGTVVILDPRLITRRYGKSVLKMLPQGMPVATIPTSQLAGRVKKFLRTHGAV